MPDDAVKPMNWAQFRGSLVPPLRLGVLAAVIVAGATVMMPNRYRSHATILPAEPMQPMGLGQLATLANGFGLGTLGTETDQSYIDILQSRWLHEQLLERTFEYTDISWRFAKGVNRRSTWRGFLKVKNLDEAVEASQARLVARRDLKTRTLTLSIETRSPQLSQQLVWSAVELLQTFLIQQGQKRGGERAAFIHSRMRETEKEVFESELRMKQFLDKNRNYLLSSDPVLLLQGQRMEAELKLRRQQIVTLATMYEHALLESKNDVPALRVLDAGHLPERKSGPTRSLISLATLVMVGVGDWMRRNALRLAQLLPLR